MGPRRIMGNGGAASARQAARVLHEAPQYPPRMRRGADPAGDLAVAAALAGQGFFCPSLDIHHDDGGYRVHLDQEGFARFTAAAFP